MSLSFDLLSDRRAALERDRRWRHARCSLLGCALGSFLVALCCAVFAYTLYGFSQP